MSRFKCIIFDFDGVILDSVDVKTKAFAEMYRPYGHEIEKKVVRHHLYYGGVSRYEKFKIYQSQFLGESVNNKSIEDLAVKFSNLVLKKVIASEFIFGAKEFLNDYFDKVPLFIATGTPQIEIEEILVSRKLNLFFKETHGSPKEKTEIIQIILDKYEFQNSEVLFVGDAITDFEAAKRKAVDFIGVKNKWTIFPKGTTLIQNIEELRQFV